MEQNITINVTQTFLIGAYLTLHVLFGLVTHYHSVVQVRRWNIKHSFTDAYDQRIPSWKTTVWFVPRMVWGLPVFLLARIISPTGNKWHMTPQEIKDFNS